jgi:hypothetical protein
MPETIVGPIERLMTDGRLRERDLEALEQGKAAGSPDLQAVQAWRSQNDVSSNESCLTVEKC